MNSASLSAELTTSTQSPSSGVKARASPKTPPVSTRSRMVRLDPQDIGRFREEHSMDYSDLAVFHGITNNEVDAMIHCFCMRRARYESGQTICTYGEGGGEVGVLLRGQAELVRYDWVCSVTSWNMFCTRRLWWAQAFSQRFIRWP